MRPLLSPVHLCAAAALVIACGHAPPPPRAHAPTGALMKDEWLRARATALGLDPAQAARRDAALDERAPPPGFWDQQTAAQAAALWGQHCAQCHGARGRLEGVPPEEPRPRVWGGFGPTMGFFFGGDKMRAGLYRRIADGGEVREGRPSRMPAWREALAKEQIWALVAFIERL